MTEMDRTTQGPTSELEGFVNEYLAALSPALKLLAPLVTDYLAQVLLEQGESPAEFVKRCKGADRAQEIEEITEATRRAANVAMKTIADRTNQAPTEESKR